MALDDLIPTFETGERVVYHLRPVPEVLPCPHCGYNPGIVVVPCDEIVVIQCKATSTWFCLACSKFFEMNPEGWWCVVDTNFERKELKRILENDRELEPWRVGEGLAECYLNHHRDCCFPWPDSRDERKSGSCLPGADLVGFRGSGETIRFTFGEVKTSGEKKYPPTAMYGRTGLKKQLEDLRDTADIRDDLVKYLGYRAPKAAWKADYIAASRRYLHDNRDVVLFGCLIRDVQPNENDLSARVAKLSESCPTQMFIELMAIYLPTNSVECLGKRMIAIRKGGDAS